MSQLTDQDKKLVSDVEIYGWHVVKVIGDKTGPGFGYSVGLYKSFKHPEILIVGLDLELIHSLINNIGYEIRTGKVFQPNNFYSDIIDGFDCYFTSVENRYYRDYVGYGF